MTKLKILFFVTLIHYSISLPDPGITGSKGYDYSNNDKVKITSESELNEVTIDLQSRLNSLISKSSKGLRENFNEYFDKFYDFFIDLNYEMNDLLEDVHYYNPNKSLSK